MRKLIINITIILLLIFSASLLLNKIIYPAINITPWYLGSDLMGQKQQLLLKNRGEYNTLLIGSSRVYRQINPAVLDSAIKGIANTSTFNFGLNWLFAPETFYVYNNLVENENMQFDYVLIELSKIRTVDYDNLHTTRTIYWYDWNGFSIAMKAIWSSNFFVPEKLYNSAVHIISYTDHLINLGYVTAAFNFKENIDINSNDVDFNGYESLAASAENRMATVSEENAMKRNAEFLKDTSVVTRRKIISEKYFNKFDKQPELLKKHNRYYAGVLNKMAEDAKKRGTQLIFLLSPRIDGSQYDELIPLFHHLHPAHRIEISDARKYPELYMADYSFDETHLNDRGAGLYSAILARKLNELSTIK